MSDTAQQTPLTMYARVVAHKNTLVIEWLTETSDDRCVTPYDRHGNMGYVCMDSNLIGVSDEAYALLRKVRRGRDAIGAIDSFQSAEGKFVFATFGGRYALVDIDHPDAEGSSTYTVPDRASFQTIDNTVPPEAMEAITALEGMASK